MCMALLMDDLASMRLLREASPSEALTSAMQRCHDVAQALATKQETWAESGRTKRIAFVLASGGFLREKQGEFRDRVHHVHSLVQSMVLRNITEKQQKSMMEHYELRNLLQSFLQEQERRGHNGTGPGLGDDKSVLSTGGYEGSDVQSLADTVTAASKVHIYAQNIDISLTPAVITLVHKNPQKFVPVQAKYDTGSDANFITRALLEEHDFSDLMEDVDGGEEEFIFDGVNHQTYVVKHSITLHWCPSNERKTRMSTFNVVDAMGYDLLLGMPHIQRYTKSRGREEEAKRDQCVRRGTTFKSRRSSEMGSEQTEKTSGQVQHINVLDAHLAPAEHELTFFGIRIWATLGRVWGTHNVRGGYANNFD
ncbi:hypothetical protein Q7P37_002303 [Cladosporium fusiforme]